ncbi:hypothetical protein FVEN_g12606 [Fusarium venenatum]|uniref:DhaK domain-containing protein n=1 Tax=Fusarium venenatum TaxID=56646 RepID=A0A2L2TD67_9HYPO|nr:uncharacterized protein FVRRES_07807 [Fusarium venenatum]KAG8362452.1 hypothetical protein FVEN_g12606 [Fusarium venenatum]CEI63371.1 unnamed protein product [Fusarium venenatum]
MAPSSKGAILFISNYTGDRLHSGLPMEKAKAEGLVNNIAILVATDNVSIPNSKTSRLDRRGLPGYILTIKILGAASKRHYTFEKCFDIGQAVNALIGAFETSLNAPTFSITPCNPSNAARQSNSDVDALLQLLETNTTAASWPNTTWPAYHDKRQSLSNLNKTSTLAKLIKC